MSFETNADAPLFALERGADQKTKIQTFKGESVKGKYTIIFLALIGFLGISSVATA